MARLTDELMERVTAAALRLSDGRVEELVAQAQAEAETEVKELFKSAIKAALLRRAVARLEPIAENGDRGNREPEGQAGDPRNARRSDSLPMEQDPGDGAPAETVDDASLRYVYCITRKSSVRSADRLPANLLGVNDTSRFDIVRFGEVEAITSPVGPASFGEEAIHERVQDPEWIAREVRAHERVLRAAISGGPVIPFRFCTVLRGREAVAEVLRTHHDAIRETLASFVGHGEWGVKVFHRPAADGMPGAGAGEDTPSGREYLARRHRALRSRGEERDAARATAAAIHEQLSAVARMAVEIPGSGGRLAGEAGEADEAAAVVFNGAYLVPDDNTATFHAAVAALNEQYASQNLSCEVTGPWPPYSFVNLDLSLPAAR